MLTNYLPIFSAFLLTLVAHIIARVLTRILAKRMIAIPMIIIAMLAVIALLFLFQWDYQDYYRIAQPVFDHLLGYVVVLLAVPLASMNLSGLPLKRLSLIILMGTLIGALLPMGLAIALSLSQDTILSFATRSVTTPIGLSIANIINAPLAMANLIIIVSGLLGAGVGRLLFRNIKDDRAKGLAMGISAHAFGTVEAWQISHTAGRYSAFGLAVNGLITAIWLPIFIQFYSHHGSFIGF